MFLPAVFHCTVVHGSCRRTAGKALYASRPPKADGDGPAVHNHRNLPNAFGHIQQFGKMLRIRLHVHVLMVLVGLTGVGRVGSACLAVDGDARGGHGVLQQKLSIE